MKSFKVQRKSIKRLMLMLMICLCQKIIKIKSNSMYLIGYLNKVVRPLVLILPKRNKYIKNLNVRDEDKDKLTINWCLSI